MIKFLFFHFKTLFLSTWKTFKCSTSLFLIDIPLLLLLVFQPLDFLLHSDHTSFWSAPREPPTPSSPAAESFPSRRSSRSSSSSPRRSSSSPPDASPPHRLPAARSKMSDRPGTFWIPSTIWVPRRRTKGVCGRNPFQSRQCFRAFQMTVGWRGTWIIKSVKKSSITKFHRKTGS